MRDAVRFTFLAAAGLLLAAQALTGQGLAPQADAPYGDIILAQEEAFLDFAVEPDEVLRLFGRVLEGDGIVVPDGLDLDGWNLVEDMWFRTERLPFKEGVWTRFRLRVGDFNSSEDLDRAETLLTRMATLLDTGRASDPPRPAEPLEQGLDEVQLADSSYIPRAEGDNGYGGRLGGDQLLYEGSQDVVYVPEIVTVYSFLPAWSFGWYGYAPYYGGYGSYGSYGSYGRYAYGHGYGYGYGHDDFGHGYGYPYGSWYGHHGSSGGGDVIVIIEDDDAGTGDGGDDGSAPGDPTDPGDVADSGDDDGRGGDGPGGVVRGDDDGLGRRAGTVLDDDDGRSRPRLDPTRGGSGAGRSGSDDVASGPTRRSPTGPVLGEPTRRPRSVPVARRPLGEATQTRTPTVRRAPIRTLADGGTRSTPTVRRPVPSSTTRRRSSPTVGTIPRATPTRLDPSRRSASPTRLPTRTRSTPPRLSSPTIGRTPTAESRVPSTPRMPTLTRRLPNPSAGRLSPTSARPMRLRGASPTRSLGSAGSRAPTRSARPTRASPTRSRGSSSRSSGARSGGRSGVRGRP